MLNPLKWARTRLAFAAAVILLGTGAAYCIETSPPVYAESATVMFSLPAAQNFPNAYDVFASSLITSGEAMVQILMSPAVQRQIEAVGRGTGVSLALVNLYSEQYPEYSLPLATLTATSPAAANTRRTFAAAARVLDGLLAAWQQRGGVRPGDLIPARILGDSGPVIQTGSRLRVFGGLALLTAIAVRLTWDGAGRWGGRRRPGPRHRGRRTPVAVTARRHVHAVLLAWLSWPKRYRPREALGVSSKPGERP